MTNPNPRLARNTINNVNLEIQWKITLGMNWQLNNKAVSRHYKSVIIPIPLYGA